MGGVNYKGDIIYSWAQNNDTLSRSGQLLWTLDLYFLLLVSTHDYFVADMVNETLWLV
jgi:hypothetical protein